MVFTNSSFAYSGKSTCCKARSALRQDPVRRRFDTDQLTALSTD